MLRVNCGGVSNGNDLQNTLAILAGYSITQVSAALRQCGPCLLILEDLDESTPNDLQAQSVSVEETIRTWVDLCPQLHVVRITSSALFGDEVFHVNALDQADIRSYIENAKHPTELASNYEIFRVHEATGGVPELIDRLLNALAYTSLNDAIAELEQTARKRIDTLPTSVKERLSGILAARTGDVSRIRRLLQILSILDRGETLNTVKRVEPTEPIWAEHAKYLQDLGYLDIVYTTPTGRDTIYKYIGTTEEKLLRVPKHIREHVLADMDEGTWVELHKAAACIYFGDDWRTGGIRMRRRFNLTDHISKHRAGNEMIVLRRILSRSSKFALPGEAEAAGVCLNYANQLQSKGLYGEAFEAAMIFLDSQDFKATSLTSTTVRHLKIIAGKSARMIGERTKCVQLLSEALPGLRKDNLTSELIDVLCSLALAHDGLEHEHEALEAAKEVIKLTNAKSSDNL